MNSLYYRLFTFLISVFAITSIKHEVDLYVFMHILIIGISSYSLYSYAKQPFTLHKIFHIFNLFFFGIAPVLQYYGNVRFLYEPTIPKNVKYTVSFVILITTILYNVIYDINYRNTKPQKAISFIKKLNFSKKNIKLTTSLFLIGASLFALFMMLYINGFNIMKLLIKGGDIVKGSGNAEESFTVSKSLGLITNQFIRPIPLIVFIISMMYNRKRKLFNTVLFLLFFITCCPTGLARNATAGYYLPLLMLFVPLFQKKHMFVSTMIGGIMVVFPFLNNFRHYNENTDLSIGLDYEMFTDMHFDAYMTFCRVVNLELITYGNQLLGVFFFFVPRSIWPSKAQSSGYFHAEVMGLKFKNLACAYLGEGYINFGFIGVFLFVFFLAWSSAKMDRLFWVFTKYNTFFNVLYVLLVAMLLFILRGDLMNGYAYTLGVLLSAMTIFKLTTIINKIRFK